MAIKRIDSVFDEDSLKREFSFFLDNISKSQSAIESLYATTKSIKTSDLAGFAKATKEVETAMSGAETATKKTRKSFDDTVKAAKDIVTSNIQIGSSYEKMSGTLDQNLSLQLQYKATLTQLRKEQKELSTAFAGTAESQDKLNRKQIEVAASIKQIEGANAELTRTIRLQVKENNAAAGSVDEMKAQYDRLFQVYRGLTEADRNSDFGVGLGKDLEVLSNKINDIQKSVGNFSSNVGRYSESLVKPFQILENKLSEIRDNLSKGIGLGGGTDSDSIKRAEAAAAALQQGLEKAGKEGATLTQQVNVLDNALQTFITTSSKGDTTSTGFITELGTEIGRVKNEISEAKSTADGFANGFKSYSGTFSQAFDVLKNELSQLRKQLSITGKDTPGFKKLEQEEKLLTQLTQNLGRAFKNPTQELRAFQNAAKTLGQQFGLTSDQFQNFVQEVGSKKDQLDDIQGTINFNASDTKYLDGVVSAVNGLVGVYGVAESAQALFGDGSEETAKSMQKLQAILTLVTSLQSVLNAVQTESGAVQVALAVKTGLLNAARTVQAALSTANVAATQAQVIADAELAIAAQAVTIATAEQAIATDAAAVSNVAAAATAEGAAVALTGEAAAANVATAATTKFSTALVASGIGAIILAIAAGVVYLVSKMNEWEGSAKETREANEALQKSLKDLTGAQREYNDSLQISVNMELDMLEKLASKRKEAGVNSIESLAIDKQVAEKRAKYAADDVRMNDVSIESIDKERNAYQLAALGVQSAQKVKIKALQNAANEGKTLSESSIKALDANVESFKIDAENTKASLDFKLSIYQKNLDAQNALELVNIQQQKLNADERRKLILETSRIESDLIVHKNSMILSNEKSTQAERIAAIKSNSAEQLKVINAELANVQNDPTKRGTAEESIALKKAAADRQKLSSETNKQIFDVDESFRKRRLAAELEVTKIKLEYDKNLQEQLAENENNLFEDRLKSAEEFSLSQQGITDAEYQYKLATTILSKEERLAVDADYNAKTVANAADAQQKIYNIIKSQIEKEQQLRSDSAEGLQRVVNSIDLALTRNYADDVKALSDSLQKKKISYQEYTKALEKLDYDYRKKTLQNELQALKNELEIYKDNTVQILAEEQELADTKELLAKSVDDQERKNLLSYIEILEKKLQADKAYADKRIDILKDIAKKETEINKGTSDNEEKTREEKLQGLSDKISAVGEIINNSIAAISNLAAIGLDAQQRQVDHLEKTQQNQFDAEQERIQRSSMSEEEKAQKMMELEAVRQAQKEQNERTTRRIEIERARYEKASNIASIITSTALAVVNALKIQPYGIALAAVIGALGAAQLARAIATPIPQYKHGRGFGKEEIAITGDGGVSEYIVHKDGSINKTPAVATLTHLMPTDRVIPNEQALRRELAIGAIPVQGQRIDTRSSSSISRHDMARFTDKIVEAVSDIVIPPTTFITKEGWRVQNSKMKATSDWINKKIKGN